MRVAVRGFVGSELRFEEIVDADKVDLAELARNHTEAMANVPHMIEVEFLDEPNPRERFFRFGTDPSGMVMPIAIDIEKYKICPDCLQPFEECDCKL